MTLLEWGVDTLKKRNQFSWMLAFASMTAGGVSLSGTSPCRHPWAWPEGPGQQSPYFGGALTSPKSGIHAPWMLAFASMTGEGDARVKHKDDMELVVR